MKKLRYALVLDTETTSSEPPPAGDIVEVAVALYDLKHTQVVDCFSTLIRCSHNEAESVNGIPPAMLKNAPEPEKVWPRVFDRAEIADIVIAHNAEFDRQYVPDLKKPWVCSCNDIEWPGQRIGGSLAGLALGLGLGVASAHRAMTDVDTLCRILSRVAEKHDLDALLRYGMRPKATFHALVSYNNRFIAKEHGFRWDGEKSVWWRRMAVEDARKLPFKTKVETNE